uniref:Uncharacterized protein n=1 Tax=Ciona intestinalis TaxID=7719 RepID=H2XMU9_CIOIN
MKMMMTVKTKLYLSPTWDSLFGGYFFNSFVCI